MVQRHEDQVGQELNLIKNYPQSKRDLENRTSTKAEARAVAMRFDKEYFDGDRSTGYGGYSYQSRFWGPCIPDFIQAYGLNKNSKILDVGCGKGFMLYDFKQAIPDLTISGIDISAYAIENAKQEVAQYLEVGDARKLPFEDNSFDTVFAINTLHNLDGEDIDMAFKEVERVSRKHSFVVVDAYRNEQERLALMDWNLTAKTIKHVDDWAKYFEKVNYTGDYYWFTP